MYIEVDGNVINIEVRCHACDEVLYVESQYEYGNDTIIVEVETHKCEED